MSSYQQAPVFDRASKIGMGHLCRYTTNTRAAIKVPSACYDPPLQQFKGAAWVAAASPASQPATNTQAACQRDRDLSD